MKIWIAKYALTEGILHADVLMPYTKDAVLAKLGDRSIFLYPNDWHETREAAVTRAEQMRVAKLRSLEKQIKRIEALRFE